MEPDGWYYEKYCRDEACHGCGEVHRTCVVAQTTCVAVQSTCVVAQSTCVAVQSTCVVAQSTCVVAQSTCVHNRRGNVEGGILDSLQVDRILCQREARRNLSATEKRSTIPPASRGRFAHSCSDVPRI